ncbi:MBL fold metallo-hydrolase [Umboniibacter marinipuniceus]|uniref:Glyoxylase-like metal-dependent hydrolase (Beta-lactamase superfamily II) n=1 Tax=Umboniibacter marinipuniceus TaxID=569599 RepID=A0A3M0A7R4_9GAMM|nr:MBL fold metallo-hydrolase [Umboniibacter marinipuniceus]RMA81113.1 glyoxylase-like metal-dependent hydrolase (beta-lactamase superfamily II) [Umboniibacter marinipuniceus]
MKKLFAVMSLMLMSTVSLAQDRFADVALSFSQVKDNVWVLFGAGGNIGLSFGDDGVVVIDTQFSELSERHYDAIAAEFPGYDATLVLNTHYHGDHAGGNPFWEAHAHILSHNNVRTRLAAANKPGLPSLTYSSAMEVYLNGQHISLVHPGPAHTDGDTVVIWNELNVVHTGDLFFKDRFPYVDLESGGSVQGYYDAVTAIIANMDADTKIIPGHGELATLADYQTFQMMLGDSIAWMSAAKADGKTLEQLIDEDVPAKWRDWGWQFISNERWITTLYNDIN